MKDLFDKFAFGFIMAQLVPGTVIVLSATLFAVDAQEISPLSRTEVAKSVLQIWTSTPSLQVVLVVLSVAAGMTIHGMHWSILGYYESCDRDGGVFSKWWHRKLWTIVLIGFGPLLAIWELLSFLVFGRDTAEVALDENAPKIPNDRIAAFTFVEDFYLHFAQFYAHTSYALVFACCCVVYFCVTNSVFTSNLPFIGGLYLAAGTFYVFGRIQLASLFLAEQELAGIPLKGIPDRTRPDAEQTAKNGCASKKDTGNDHPDE